MRRAFSLREVLQLVRERVGQRLLQQRELLREGVDLRVLRARGFLRPAAPASPGRWPASASAPAARRATTRDLAPQLALEPFAGGQQFGAAGVGCGGLRSSRPPAA
jgi:hypothetical protein